MLNQIISKIASFQPNLKCFDKKVSISKFTGESRAESGKMITIYLTLESFYVKTPFGPYNYNCVCKSFYFRKELVAYLKNWKKYSTDEISQLVLDNEPPISIQELE